MVAAYRPAVVALAAAALIAVSAAPAAAQAVQLPAPTVITHAAGEPPLGPGWYFTPTLAIGADRDSNVTLTSRVLTATGDYLASLTPSLDLVYTGHRTNLRLAYTGTYQRYRDLGQLNSYTQRAQFDLSRTLSPRLSFYAQNGTVFSPTTDQIQLNGVPFLMVGSRLEAFRAGLRGTLGRFTTLDIGYGFEWVGFDSANAFAPQLRGGYTNGVVASLKRKLGRRLAVGVDGRASRLVTTSSPVRSGIYETLGTLSYDFTPTTSIAGGFGMVHSTTASLLSTTAPAWAVGFRHRAGRTEVTVTSRNSILPSYGSVAVSQNRDLSANLRVPMANNRLYVAGSITYQQSDPIAYSQSDPNVNAALGLRSYWLVSTFGCVISRWLSAEVYFGRNYQTNKLPGGQVDRNRFGVQIVTSKPLRIR